VFAIDCLPNDNPFPAQKFLVQWKKDYIWTHGLEVVMQYYIKVILTFLLFNTAAVVAGDYLGNKSEVTALLSGTTLEGTYLRTHSPYSLQFHTDGSLVNQKGEKGRWWVSDSGQYCREWSTGRLKGHQACLDLALESDGIAIYSSGKKVATGRLTRK
jgi:hypothetical protein